MTIKKNMIKCITMCVCMLILVFSATQAPAANEAFKQLVTAIENDSPQLVLLDLLEKYKGTRLRGQAYLITITRDVDNNVIAVLSTTEDPRAQRSITIMVYVRSFMYDKLSKMKAGEKVWFLGNLKEIKLRTIITDQGLVQ